MNNSHLCKMFNQSVVWGETIKATASLKAESVKNHTLDNVRISMQSDGNSINTDGEQTASSSVLYILNGYSTCDGKDTLPGINAGDGVTTATGREFVVESVRTLYGVAGDLHHLEVVLK